MKKLSILLILTLAIVKNSNAWDCVVYGLKETKAKKDELNQENLNLLSDIEKLQSMKDSLELEKALGTSNLDENKLQARIDSLEKEIKKRFEKHSDLKKELTKILDEEQEQNFIAIGSAYSNPDEANHCRITDAEAKKIVENYNKENPKDKVVPIHSCGPITRAFRVCPNRLENVDLEAIKKTINLQ